ncbi:hypothetical protein IFM12275_65540 [Nocardia sputorum]|uniref:Uncharacterized protein n=1 Tax=Nocardia sputorum TaxID=2984338 RepID=A0ABN6TZH1_9NOCA|nr:hypothetical protein IFM12275_65540 [Nocardia sputorum]BDT98328.1 hypothetical protein IFM12276_13570 [Nocardia sputorum]
MEWFRAPAAEADRVSRPALVGVLMATTLGSRFRRPPHARGRFPCRAAGGAAVPVSHRGIGPEITRGYESR